MAKESGRDGKWALPADLSFLGDYPPIPNDLPLKVKRVLHVCPRDFLAGAADETTTLTLSPIGKAKTGAGAPTIASIAAGDLAALAAAGLRDLGSYYFMGRPSILMTTTATASETLFINQALGTPRRKLYAEVYWVPCDDGAVPLADEVDHRILLQCGRFDGTNHVYGDVDYFPDATIDGYRWRSGGAAWSNFNPTLENQHVHLCNLSPNWNRLGLAVDLVNDVYLFAVCGVNIATDIRGRPLLSAASTTDDNTLHATFDIVQPAANMAIERFVVGKFAMYELY